MSALRGKSDSPRILSKDGGSLIPVNDKIVMRVIANQGMKLVVMTAPSRNTTFLAFALLVSETVEVVYVFHITIT